MTKYFRPQIDLSTINKSVNCPLLIPAPRMEDSNSVTGQRSPEQPWTTVEPSLHASSFLNKLKRISNATHSNLGSRGITQISKGNVVASQLNSHIQEAYPIILNPQSNRLIH